MLLLFSILTEAYLNDASRFFYKYIIILSTSREMLKGAYFYLTYYHIRVDIGLRKFYIF